MLVGHERLMANETPHAVLSICHLLLVSKGRSWNFFLNGLRVRLLNETGTYFGVFFSFSFFLVLRGPSEPLVPL